ncbi:MAG: ATP synthase F1 subunit delta [Crocinitomicaceae bacterium]|nr:ATP synthase F1 subunit delta [Crocinitomicaceae bacterium]|tara:strand:+ start:521 stop:1078 length:558 start_codon:yes stop_codon:yes gene_type:complete
MKINKTAARYSKALLGLSIEKNNLEDVFKDMTLIVDTAKESKDLSLLLESKVIKADDKSAVLDKVFGSHISEISSRFIKIIVNHGREDILVPIAEAFIHQYKQHKGIVSAEVTTAVALSNEERENIKGIVTQMQQGTVELTEKINPEIVGGMIIRVGDKQIDASVSRRLETLKRELINKSYEAQI